MSNEFRTVIIKALWIVSHASKHVLVKVAGTWAVYPLGTNQAFSVFIHLMSKIMWHSKNWNLWETFLLSSAVLNVMRTFFISFAILYSLRVEWTCWSTAGASSIIFSRSVHICVTFQVFEIFGVSLLYEWNKNTPVLQEDNGLAFFALLSHRNSVNIIANSLSSRDQNNH